MEAEPHKIIIHLQTWLKIALFFKKTLNVLC